jgi:hypothetical protein
MWKKSISILLLGMVSLLISYLPFQEVVKAEQILGSGYGVVEDFHQFSGTDLRLELEGTNLSSDGHVTNQTTSLKLSNNKVLNSEFLLLEYSRVVGKWEFNDETEQTLSLETRLEPETIYQIVENVDGDRTSVGYFTVKKGELVNLPPTLLASSRTVVKDDPNFNIMDGVTAYDVYGNDITSKVSYKGQVDISKLGIYPIIYTVKDINGLSATKSITITVQREPSLLEPPVLDPMTASDTTITGTSKYLANAKVYVILGTNQETYRTNLEKDGSFRIFLEHPYPSGTGITAYIEDGQGNQSAKVYGVVQEGSVTVGVNRILSSDTMIAGYTAPGASVEVAVNNKQAREHIYKGVADSSGKYIIDMKGQTYPSGTTVVVTATINGVSGSQAVIVYPKTVSINTLSAGSNIISGEADPNANVYLEVNTKKYQFKADKMGNFYGTLDIPVQNGDQIIAYQISNDIESERITVIVH